MKARVVLGSEAKKFLSSLAPGPRLRLHRAIKGLADGKGDIKQLEGKLVPYWRLRVNNIRVVYAERFQGGQRTIFCFFAGYRATIYSVLEQLLASEFLDQLRN